MRDTLNYNIKIELQFLIMDFPGKEGISDYVEGLRYEEQQDKWIYNHITQQLDDLNQLRVEFIPKGLPHADWRFLPDPLIPWCLPNTADRHNDWMGLFGVCGHRDLFFFRNCIQPWCALANTFFICHVIFVHPYFMIS